MQIVRLALAYLAAPIIAVSNKGFSCAHRQNNDWVYRLIDTVAANDIARAVNPKAGA